jgi:hypothetical protein
MTGTRYFFTNTTGTIWQASSSIGSGGSDSAFFSFCRLTTNVSRQILSMSDSPVIAANVLPENELSIIDGTDEHGTAVAQETRGITQYRSVTSVAVNN